MKSLLIALALLLGITASTHAHAAGEIQNLPDLELAKYCGQCIQAKRVNQTAEMQNRARLAQAQMRGAAKVVRNTSFAAGFSHDSASQMVSASADAQGDMAKALGNLAPGGDATDLATCPLINDEYNRRFKRSCQE